MPKSLKTKKTKKSKFPKNQKLYFRQVFYSFSCLISGGGGSFGLLSNFFSLPSQPCKSKPLPSCSATAKPSQTPSKYTLILNFLLNLFQTSFCHMQLPSLPVQSYCDYGTFGHQLGKWSCSQIAFATASSLAFFCANKLSELVSESPSTLLLIASVASLSTSITT